MRASSDKSLDKVKSLAKNIFKGAIYLEVLAFIGCYAFYRKTNRDPEFRYKLYQNGAGYGILQSYYKIGETLNSELKIREHDLELWRKQGKPV